MNSIRGRLFIWLSIFISLLLLGLVIFLHTEIKLSIIGSVDHTLHSNLQLLKALLHEKDDIIEFELNESVLGEYTVPLSGHYYQVFLDGHLLAVSPSIKHPDFKLDAGKIEMSDDEASEFVYTNIGPANEPIRVYSHTFSYDDITLKIVVAESLRDSLLIIQRFEEFLMISLPVCLLITGFISSVIIKTSLRPLSEFSETIERITYKNLHEQIESKDQATELRTLALSFNGMLSRLYKAFDVEKQIISDASHELKTPISIIKAECEVTLSRKRSSEEYEAALMSIKGSNEKMKNLINDLLSLARLDSGILQTTALKSFSLKDLLKQVIQLVRVIAEEKHISLLVDEISDTVITGDKERLTEAFLNIIENAVIYNQEGGFVNISATEEKSDVKITIKDNGQGIKEENLAKIFDRFHRGDSSRNSEGTGLGLSIAKAIISAHGGRIEVESCLGKGTSFEVYLILKKSNF